MEVKAVNEWLIFQNFTYLTSTSFVSYADNVILIKELLSKDDVNVNCLDDVSGVH